MKKAIITSLIFGAILFFSSCVKENHTVRLKNNYPFDISNVNIGSASLGMVRVGEISDYKSINTGDFTISGTASNGQQLAGGGSITGAGKHKWTVTLSSAGTLSIKEDK